MSEFQFPGFIARERESVIESRLFFFFQLNDTTLWESAYMLHANVSYYEPLFYKKKKKQKPKWLYYSSTREAFHPCSTLFQGGAARGHGVGENRPRHGDVQHRHSRLRGWRGSLDSVQVGLTTTSGACCFVLVSFVLP